MFVQQDEQEQSKTSLTRTTQVCQSHVAIEVLLNLGANHSTNRNKHSQHTAEICTTTNHSTNRNKHSQHTAEICTACCLCYTGQTDGLLRSDLVTPGTKNHLWNTNREKQTSPQNLAKQLGTQQELTQTNTKQSSTRLSKHLSHTCDFP
jgi:hypothetical protein